MLFVLVVAVSAGAVAATGGSGLGVAAGVPVGLLGVGAAGSEFIFLLAAAVAELTGFGCGGIADLGAGDSGVSDPFGTEACGAVATGAAWPCALTITGGEAEVFPRAAKWYPVTPATAIAATIADTATHGLFLAGVTATGLATLLAAVIAPAAATERPELVSRCSRLRSAR